VTTNFREKQNRDSIFIPEMPKQFRDNCLRQKIKLAPVTLLEKKSIHDTVNVEHEAQDDESKRSHDQKVLM